MNVVGDAIATLQVDQNGNKPTPSEAVINMLEKLQDPKALQAPASSKEVFLRCMKYAAILTAIFAILTIPAVQRAFEGVIPNQFMKLGIQSLLFFIIATVLLKTSSKCGCECVGSSCSLPKK